MRLPSRVLATDTSGRCSRDIAVDLLSRQLNCETRSAFFRFGTDSASGGGGRAFNSAPGMNDYNFAGWLVQHSVTERLILGGEVFYQGAPSEDSR